MDFFSSLDTMTFFGVTLSSLLSALLLLVVCFILRKLILRLLARILNRIPHTAESIGTFITGSVNILMWAVTVLIVADRLGIPVTSLVALISVVGVALSLALQNILTNIFSGITLLATKPIQAGEYVEINGSVGTVRRVGLFYSVLTTYDGKTLYVPNSIITSGVVTNYSDNPDRRIDIDVSASYGDEPKKVIDALLMAARTTDGILLEKPIAAYVTEYGSSSIRYSVYAYSKNSEFLKTKYAFTERIFYAFRERGVTMTYDHLNVHMSDKE